MVVTGLCLSLSLFGKYFAEHARPFGAIQVLPLLPLNFFSSSIFFSSVCLCCPMLSRVEDSSADFHPHLFCQICSFFFCFFFLFVFTVTHQLKRTWLNLSLPLLSLSSSFSLPPTSCNRMEQIRESIQCNHDKWVPAVRACLCVCTLVSVCACVCLGESCWEITNESISCYHISKHCKREGWKDACVNDGWMVW